MKKSFKKCVVTGMALMTLALSSCSSTNDAARDTADDVQESDDSREAIKEKREEKREEKEEVKAINEENYIGKTEDEKLFLVGLDADGYDVDVNISDNKIVETGTVESNDYKLTIDLSKWDGNTTKEQMVELSKIFWYCYPKMCERFGDVSNPATDVILAIENEGYEIAEQYDNIVHLHDMWLHDNPTDYDCITHEFAHVIQDSAWDENFLEYSSYIERFADCCRYEYALNKGYYNDEIWTLWEADSENTRENSVRFLVWLDYMYSDGNKDVIKSFFTVCHEGIYPAGDWDEAWNNIFEGTKIDGLSIDDVWEMYVESDFAYLSSYAAKGDKSELLSKYDVRGKLGL